MNTLELKKKITEIQTVLKLTFTIVPIAAGIDKFTNILTNWGDYVHPDIVKMLPLEISYFMAFVGLVEIIAGLLVFFKPIYGGIVVSSWLLLISLLLLFSWHYPDVAVRDIVMSMASIILVKITLINNSFQNE